VWLPGSASFKILQPPKERRDKDFSQIFVGHLSSTSGNAIPYHTVIQHFMKRLLMHDAVKYVLAESTYFTEIQ
jgi:hypothetical protein